MFSLREKEKKKAEMTHFPCTVICKKVTVDLGNIILHSH